MTESNQNNVVSLSFALDVEDGWPPVAIESLPFVKLEGCTYQLTTAPLFVKDLSVDDVIAIQSPDQNGNVNSWRHIKRSRRTTVWLLRLHKTDEIPDALSALRDLGCNTIGIESFGTYAVDVPEMVELSAVESILSNLDDRVAIAVPSLRHAE